jgi:hypothetical protein
MDKPILGYYANGEPIHEVPRGVITTAAFILCMKCGTPIRSMGGPAYGALCVPCHEAKLKEKNT